jgi:hypothetical protein
MIGDLLSWAWVIGCFVVIVFSFGFLVGHSMGENYEQSQIKIEAIERGFAYWEIDSNGSTTFKWKENTHGENSN